MADLKDIQAAAELDEQPVDIVINDKTGDPYIAPDGKPCTIGVLGSESKAVRLARQRARRKTQRRVMQSGVVDDVMIAELADIEELAAAVVRWHGFTAEGSPLELTRENVVAMLKVEHVRNQVWTGVYQHAVFFEAGSGNSSSSPEGGPDSEGEKKTEAQ